MLTSSRTKIDEIAPLQHVIHGLAIWCFLTKLDFGLERFDAKHDSFDDEHRLEVGCAIGSGGALSCLKYSVLLRTLYV